MSMTPYLEYVDKYYAYYYQYLDEIDKQVTRAQIRELRFQIEGLKGDPDFFTALFGTIVSFLPAGRPLTIALTAIKDVQPTLTAAAPVVQRWAGNRPNKDEPEVREREFKSTDDFFDLIESRVSKTREYTLREWGFIKEKFIPKVYYSNQDCRPGQPPSDTRIWNIVKQVFPQLPGGPSGSKEAARAAAIGRAREDNIKWKLAEVCIINWARATNVHLHTGGMLISWPSLKGTSRAQDEWILSNKNKLMSRPQNKEDIQYKWGLEHQETRGDSLFVKERQTATIPVDRWPKN